MNNDPQQPEQPPRKKRGPLFWTVLIVGSIVLLIIGGNAMNAMNTSATQATSTPVTQATATPDMAGTNVANSEATQNAATPYPSTPVNAGYTPPPAPKWTTTHTFSGNGSKKTAIFSVPDDWKIVYTCTHQEMGVEGVLGVVVYTSDNTIVDVAVNATCKPDVDLTKGETEEHQGGDIYLSIDGTGDWTVAIQEMK